MNPKLKAAPPVVLITLTALAAHAADDSCAAAPWQVVASIERIEPKGGIVKIEPKDGSRARQAVEYECLRGGDRVVFVRGATAVELFMAGNLRRVSIGESPFIVPDGGVAHMTAAMQALVDWWRLRPHETGAAVSRPWTKGSSPVAVVPVKGLATSTEQRVLPGTRSVVPAWRTAVAADWAATGSCLAPAEPPRTTESEDGWFMDVAIDRARIEGCMLAVIDDADAPVVTLELRSDSTPPAPESLKLNADWRQWAPGDRIAWAAWALQRGPVEWHLQALTWLREHQSQAWVAGHLFFRAVNGSDGMR